MNHTNRILPLFTYKPGKNSKPHILKPFFGIMLLCDEIYLFIYFSLKLKRRKRKRNWQRKAWLLETEAISDSMTMFLKGQTNPEMHYPLSFCSFLQSIILTNTQSVFIFLNGGYCLHPMSSQSTKAAKAKASVENFQA